MLKKLFQIQKNLLIETNKKTNITDHKTSPGQDFVLKIREHLIIAFHYGNP